MHLRDILRMKKEDISFLFTALIHIISLKGEALGGEGRKASEGIQNGFLITAIFCSEMN